MRKSPAHTSELEGAILGLLWSRGPVTPYAVRTEFLRSLNPHWSGSAGAIYPLLGRLERQGWVRATAARDDNRRTRRYTLSAAGLRGFRRWLGPPIHSRVGGVPADPLRTRIEFVEALPSPQRRRFLDAAVRDVATHLAQVEGECRRLAREPASAALWTTRGARDALRARLKWIRAVRAADRLGTFTVRSTALSRRRGR